MTPQHERDKDEGKLINPAHERDKDEGIFITPIHETDWRDNILTSEGAKGTILEPQITSINPKLLISIQNKNEMTGSQVKRIAKDMKVNGFDTSQPIDVAVVKGKTIIIDGHHRAEAAIKAGIEKVPVRVNTITQEQADALLIHAAEAKSRSY